MVSLARGVTRRYYYLTLTKEILPDPGHLLTEMYSLDRWLPSYKSAIVGRVIRN